MKTIIASIVALLLATAANAGPFGYKMGQKIEGEPDGVAADTGLSYKEMEPPGPFNRLLVFYTDTTGTCAVKSIIDVPAHVDDDDGVKHREKADWLAGRVEAEYGKPSRFINEQWDDAVSSEPHHWLRSIRHGERKYYYDWYFADAPDGISVIEVELNDGYVHLLYEFSNYLHCRDIPRRRRWVPFN